MAHFWASLGEKAKACPSGNSVSKAMPSKCALAMLSRPALKRALAKLLGLVLKMAWKTDDRLTPGRDY